MTDETQSHAGVELGSMTRQAYQELTAPELSDQIVTLEETSDPAFLPLGVRRVLYIIGLAALVVAPTIGVNAPEYAQAITTAGNLLGVAALGTALANPSR